jgi:hypothetical protein
MSTTPLTVTKEKVLAAAAQCSDAKRILTTLFPDAFKVRPIPGVHVRVNGRRVNDTDRTARTGVVVKLNSIEGRFNCAVQSSMRSQAWDVYGVANNDIFIICVTGGDAPAGQYGTFALYRWDAVDSIEVL